MVVRYRFRLYLLALVTIGGFAGLLFRLWSIQIDRHEYFSSRVPGTSDLTVRVPGVRGELKDSKGVTLATNRPSFEVIFNQLVQQRYHVNESSTSFFQAVA